jgi:hypothetical protein
MRNLRPRLRGFGGEGFGLGSGFSLGWLGLEFCEDAELGCGGDCDGGYDESPFFFSFLSLSSYGFGFKEGDSAISGFHDWIITHSWLAHGVAWRGF